MYMPSVMRVLMGERNDVNKQRKNSPENLVVSPKTLIFATN